MRHIDAAATGPTVRRCSRNAHCRCWTLRSASTCDRTTGFNKLSELFRTQYSLRHILLLILAMVVRVRQSFEHVQATRYDVIRATSKRPGWHTHQANVCANCLQIPMSQRVCCHRCCRLSRPLSSIRLLGRIGTHTNPSV